MRCDICSGHMATVLGEVYLSCEQCGELQERDNVNEAPFQNNEPEFYSSDDDLYQDVVDLDGFYIDGVLINKPEGK